MTTIIFFTLTPWSLGWTFGLVVILNIRTQQTLWETARRDSLTGLYNRLWLMESLATRLGGNQNGTTRSFCVAIIDINGFKLINDSRGHMFGDEVLKKAADILATHMGPTDSAIRYGGDEFILLIDCAGTKTSMETLRERLIRTMETPTTLDGLNLHFSISIGTAMFPEDGESVDELLKVADERMYTHKRIKYRNTEISNKEEMHG
jgi:diguanylate cyclase (GGDEF)-like protein